MAKDNNVAETSWVSGAEMERRGFKEVTAMRVCHGGVEQEQHEYAVSRMRGVGLKNRQ